MPGSRTETWQERRGTNECEVTIYLDSQQIYVHDGLDRLKGHGRAARTDGTNCEVDPLFASNFEGDSALVLPPTAAPVPMVLPSILLLLLSSAQAVTAVAKGPFESIIAFGDVDFGYASHLRPPVTPLTLCTVAGQPGSLDSHQRHLPP